MGMCYETIKRLPYQILGDKTVKNVKNDPQTIDIWPKQFLVFITKNKTKRVLLFYAQPCEPYITFRNLYMIL